MLNRDMAANCRTHLNRYLHYMHRILSLALLGLIAPCQTGCDPHRNMTPKQLVDSPSTFHFSENHYPIASATVAGWLNDPVWCDNFNNGKGKSLQWLLEIEGASIPADDLGSPQVSFDGLDIDVTRWQHLDGFHQSWSHWKNPRTGDRYAMTYHSGHDSVEQGELRVFGRHQNQFRVVASGGLPNTTPFELDATFTFTKITVIGSEMDNEKSLQQRLNDAMPDNDLILTEFEREGAGDRRLAKATFIPRAMDSK